MGIFIKNSKEYKAYLKKTERLMDRNHKKNSAQGRLLIAIADAIVNYEEDKKFFIKKPSAVDAIKFRMEQQGLSSKDLLLCIGSRSKVSELLSGKITLNLRMIRSIHKMLNIPLDILVFG